MHRVKDPWVLSLGPSGKPTETASALPVYPRTSTPRTPTVPQPPETGTSQRRVSSEIVISKDKNSKHYNLNKGF